MVITIYNYHGRFYLYMYTGFNESPNVQSAIRNQIAHFYFFKLLQTSSNSAVFFFKSITTMITRFWSFKPDISFLFNDADNADAMKLHDDAITILQCGIRSLFSLIVCMYV